ncbi:MAG: tetratricopeptide repeat protein [Syntrophobacteria bacterium]
MATQDFKRRLTAIFSADVEGYSRLMREDEEATVRTITAYRKAMANLIQQYRGRVVDSPGDNILAEFTSVVDAVNCAVEIQRELAERNAELPSERKMQFRIGVNLGDVIEEGERIYGDGVNIAARMEGLAEGGGICISGTVYDAIEAKLGLEYEYMGEQAVKNIPKPVRVYRVLSFPGAAAHRVVKAKKAVGRKWRNIGLTITAILVVGAAAVATWNFYLRSASPPVEVASVEKMAFPLPDKPSLAVLPFENISGDPEQEYFADGMTDDLITDLSKISGIFVIARNSVFTYKGKPVKVQQVSEELGVRYVLEGSVRKAADTVRINAQLIDATTGHHLWAERYDRDYKDIFALQNEVIGKIVSALAVKLTDTEEAQLARRPTNSLEAYDIYLRAEQAAYSYDLEELAKALSLYQRAIALDPKFAAAYAGDARAAFRVWRFNMAKVFPAHEARTRAYESIARALALNPDIPRAHFVLAYLQAVDRKYDEAIESARKAVSLDPNNTGAYLNLAAVLVVSGRPAEASAAIERALRLNPKPLPQFEFTSGWILFHLRQYERAIESLKRARDAMPTVFSVREGLAVSYAQLDRLGEAKAEVDVLLKKWWPKMNLAYYRVILRHYKREEDRDHIVNALRKAGVPEWPFGYEGREEDRLAGSAIRALLFGRTRIGHDENRVPWSIEYSEDGKWVYREPSFVATGRAWVEGDMLCKETEMILMGRKFCGYLYQNPDGTPEERDEYVYVYPLNVTYFSVKP